MHDSWRQGPTYGGIFARASNSDSVFTLTSSTVQRNTGKVWYHRHVKQPLMGDVVSTMRHAGSDDARTPLCLLWTWAGRVPILQLGLDHLRQHLRHLGHLGVDGRREHDMHDAHHGTA